MEIVHAILTVDVVLFTIIDGELAVLVQKREKDPAKGGLALVGGYVRPREDASTSATAMRVLYDKAGLKVRLLEQLGAFSGPHRDPRNWSVSVAYYALLPEGDIPQKGDRSLIPMPVNKIAPLSFDHEMIVAQAVERIRRRSVYSSLAAFLLPPTFTLSELRKTYEIVLGRKLNDSAFRRKVDELCLVRPLIDNKSKSTARPAQLYVLRSGTVTEFNRTL